MDSLQRQRRPLVQQVRDQIWQMLKEEGYKPWDRLPSEQEMVNRFEISRGALREALRVMEEERVILCQHGIGRFMAPEPSGVLSEDITRLMGTTEMAQNQGITFTCKVLSLIEQQPSADVRGFLNLEPGEKVAILERVWLDKDGPIIYSLDHFSSALLPEPLSPELFKGSLLKLIERDKRTHLDYSKTTIRAVMLDEETNRKIESNGRSPWILLEQVNYDARGGPILYSCDYHCSEKFQFRVVRRRR